MSQSSQPVIVSDDAKFYAGIGHVCVQWALLEMGFLALISAAESISFEKVTLMFGGLDMLPRCNMAINLARHEKWPQPLIRRIEAIRKALQKDGARLADRRNQAVHGAHSKSEISEHVRLTMVRWSGPKRTQEISIMDLYALGKEIAEQAQEAFRIYDDYGVWKFGSNPPEPAK